jgi:Flp pilus assembly protein TadD
VLKDEFGRFFKAAISNPTLMGTRRAMVLVWQSYYAAVFENEQEAALEMARKAVELSPSVIKFRLHLAALLARMKQFDLAREELDRADEIDTLNASTREVARERERFRKAEMEAQTKPVDISS